MENKCRSGWITWVCHPHLKPYISCVIMDTKEEAEASFCEAGGNRCRMFSDCKLVHQKITIDMPPEVAEKYDEYVKHTRR